MDIKNRIVIESFQMFGKFGIRSVTMDDIAKELGISKKTIYEHFKDKNELLRKGIDYHKTLQDARISEIKASSENVLEAMYKIMFEAVSNMQKVNPAFISDLKKYHYKLCDELMPKHEEQQIEEAVELFEKGVADGIFRDDVDIPIAARILNHQLKTLTDEKLYPNDNYSGIDVFKTIILIFTRGMATPKGMKIIDKILEQYNN